MPKHSTAPISSDARGLPVRAVSVALAAGLVVAGSACDRFPRDNPNDPGGSAPLSIERGPGEVAISDLNTIAPANNENGTIEPGETVLVSVPVDVRWTKQVVMATATVTDLNEGKCFVMALEQGQQGNQFSLSLPGTTNLPANVNVGPTRVTVGNDCEPGTILEFQVEIGPIGDKTYEVPFELEVVERTGLVERVDVVVDDSMLVGGNGDGKLDPGEVATLAVTLGNTGKSLVPGLELQVEVSGRKCVESVRTVPGRRLFYGDLLPGQEVTSPDFIQLVVAASCDMGERVVVPMVATDASGQAWPMPWEEPVEPVEVDAGMIDEDAGI